MKIALRLPWLNNGQHANHIGDHDVAESWAKYLRRRPDVAAVNIFGSRIYPEKLAGHDVIIHFWPWVDPMPGVTNILFMQNALGKEFHPAGTVGVFRDVKDRFDGWLFPSETLKRNCGMSEGAVIPFATDPEIFTYQPDDRFKYNVVFCGNDIRPAEINERYLVPALAHGLVIHSGSTWRDPRLQAVNRGRISAADLPKLYSSAKCILNITHPEHLNNGVVNQRIYDALACGGFVISDTIDDPALMAGLVCGFDVLKNFQYAQLPGGCWGTPETRRRMVLSHHTVAHRMEALMTYLKGIV